MKLSTKLSAAMGLLLVMICGLGIFSVYEFSRYREVAASLTSTWLPSTRLVQDAKSLIMDFRTQQLLHTFAVRPDRKRLYEENITKLSKQIVQINEEYKKFYTSQEEINLHQGFMKAWDEFMAFHAEVFKLSKDNRTEEASEMIRKDSVRIFRGSVAKLDEMVEFNVTNSDRLAKESEAIYSAASTLIYGIIALALLVGIIVAIVIPRGVSAQLGKDPSALEQIADRVVKGDYKIDDGSPRRGVYGSIVEMVKALEKNIENARLESENAKEQMAKANVAMQQAENASRDAQAKTQAMLVAADRLESVGQVVSDATTQLSAQIEQSDHGASESAMRLSEAATAMNQMNATVQEVARNAASASAASSETKLKAEEGAHVVEQVVEVIGKIHQMSLGLKNDMVQLNEHAQDITRIMSVISDIADQTNLLALNAAIEAARAGEAGRGFAVVADEVRKLAEKTMASTQDVGNTIKSIQASTTQSMLSVDHTVEQIAESTKLASESGKALHEIVNMVDATSDQVNAIATASEEQSAASDEINQTLLQVNDMSKQTAAAMGEAAKAIADVAAQAQKLTDLIADLKA